MFKKFNTWYDRLPEPRRFLYFFGYIATTIVLVNCHAPILVIPGAIMFAAAAAIAISRTL